MIAYHYDENGYFDGTIECQKDDLESIKQATAVYLQPANSTNFPPPEVKDGFLIRWSGEVWEYEEIEPENGKRRFQVKEIPELTIEEKNEQIRQQRQSRFVTESDPLYLDYVEAQARGDETVDDKKQLWLDKKDEIRKELPYIESEL